MKRLPAAGIVGEIALREARSTELREVMELVRSALAKHTGRDAWPHAMYPDRVVVVQDSKMLAYPYEIADQNKITFGDPVEVVADHVPVTAQREAVQNPLGGRGQAEAAGVFIEALAAEADAPPRYLVRVIRSGVSLNGVNYPAAVLREAAPLFEGVRVFVKSDAEHLAGGGKDVRQLVGRLTEPRFVEATAGGEIHAVLDVLESSPVSAQLREAVARGMTDLFGLSIDATGAERKRGRFREATRIVRVSSVDLIVEPGAGGSLIRFTEAKAAKEPDMLRQQMINAIAQRDAARAAQLADASDDDVLTAYREAVAPPATAGAGVSQDELQRTVRMVEARAEARVLIAAAPLPEKAKDRLTARFAEAADFTAADVTAAIAEETAYVDSLRESAPVSGLGSIRVEPGEQRSEKVQKLLDGFFAGERDGFRSFREAYIEITGDVNLTGQLRHCDMSRLREAAGARFTEAVSAATFNDILGDSITRRMLREYAENPLWRDWRWLVDIVPIRDFRTNERTRMGGYGNLPGVNENAAYTALTTPGDEKATYAITKRGGVETISLEAIANDDVGVIRRIPVKLGTAAARTLFEFVWDFLRTNPTVYDGVALFHATHANLGTAALDATSLAAARLRMAKQTEAGSGKRVGLVMRHLAVPADLEETARNLFARGTNNDPTFVQTLNPTIHVSPYWTDVNDWFVTADNSQIPLIELGFFNGNEEPELFVQDNPTQGSLFSHDQIKYKIRHIYGGNVMDYRGFDGSIVP